MRSLQGGHCLNKNIVMFKRGRDAILIILDPDASFESIKTALLSKVGEASRFFGGSSSAISFVGRELAEVEEEELLEILAEKANLDITVVLHGDSKDTGDGQVGRRPAASKLSIVRDNNSSETAKVQPPNRPTVGSLVNLAASVVSNENVQKQEFNLLEHNVKFQQGSLRSGQIIRYRGSVVVLGDVNPGAEILAEGNVIVLGNLKGIVHAGCMGDDRCFIAALNLRPSQLRIADKITYMPSESKNAWGGTPQYAFISDGQIYIAPLMDD